MRVKRYRDKFYVVWTEGGETKRRSLRTEDGDVAARRFEDFKRDFRPERNTIGDIMDAYIADKRHTVSRIDRIEHAWKALKPTFGHLRPDQVTREKCREYAIGRRAVTFGRRKRSTQDGTIIKELGVLRAGLQWQDKRTPATFEFPAAPAPQERHLTRAEYKKLLAAAEASPHVYMFIVLALNTAGRAEALLELTWDRADPEGNEIDLRKGTGRRKGRARVPINAPLREALRSAKKAALTDYVIEYGEKPVGSIKKGFQNACARAKLKGVVTPHVLRHTAAVWMAEKGVPMAEIAQFLGHTNSRITEKVYARFTPGYLARAAKALE